MIRTQISLTDDQMRRLRRVARERGTSIAALIRDAVDRTVPDEAQDVLERQRRAFALAGAFASGHSDTAEGHDDVLTESRRW
jgi:ferritin-like metal-binding protein YciE